jgi:hypothetical protein
MPIPTDTFWNMRRLNIAFAVSSVLLLAMTGWSIIQDYNQPWRIPQQKGRAWEAALVEDKLSGETAPEKQARLDALNKEIADKSAQMQSRQGEIDRLNTQIKAKASERSTKEFFFNNLKAQVQVQESGLQDAVTAGDREKAKRLEQQLAEPRKKLAADAREIEQIKQDQVAAKERLAELTADLDALTKQRTKMSADKESLEKKLAALKPKSLFAQVSDQARAIPLLQFVNPRERGAADRAAGCADGRGVHEDHYAGSLHDMSREHQQEGVRGGSHHRVSGRAARDGAACESARETVGEGDRSRGDQGETRGGGDAGILASLCGAARAGGAEEAGAVESNQGAECDHRQGQDGRGAGRWEGNRGF